MKFEDLHDVETDDILTCKALGAAFKVTDIDMGAKSTPIEVILIEGPPGLTSGSGNADSFDKCSRQWLYTSIKTARIWNSGSADEEVMDMDKLITLECLEPVDSAESKESKESKELVELVGSLTASRAAEIAKGRLMHEVLRRVNQAVHGDFGVFEIKVNDLDLDPVTPELEELGYVVRFSMQDDLFSVSWEPKL